MQLERTFVANRRLSSTIESFRRRHDSQKEDRIQRLAKKLEKMSSIHKINSGKVAQYIRQKSQEHSDRMHSS